MQHLTHGIVMTCLCEADSWREVLNSLSRTSLGETLEQAVDNANTSELRPTEAVRSFHNALIPDRVSWLRMETVSLSFRYAEQDYVRAMRAHYATRLRLPLDIAVTVAVAVIGAYELRSGSHAFGITLLCLSGVFALILVCVFTVIPRVWFRSQPKFRNEYLLRFSPEGIHFQTTHIDSDLKWAMYTKALVDSYSFILYYGAQQFTVIPKRVFQNGSERQRFEQLLSQHVSNVVDKTK